MRSSFSAPGLSLQRCWPRFIRLTGRRSCSRTMSCLQQCEVTGRPRLHNCLRIQVTGIVNWGLGFYLAMTNPVMLQVWIVGEVVQRHDWQHSILAPEWFVGDERTGGSRRSLLSHGGVHIGVPHASPVARAVCPQGHQTGFRRPAHTHNCRRVRIQHFSPLIVALGIDSLAFNCDNKTFRYKVK